MNRVIIDAHEKDIPPIDNYKAKIILQKVGLKIGDDLKYYTGEEMQNRAEYKKFCDVTIKFYELILAEDNETAGNTLRYVYRPD